MSEEVQFSGVGLSRYVLADDDIELNAGRETASVLVKNTGDRPIQVGSHYHFFETNRALEFDREKAFGMRLNIAAGTSVRFEPGDEREVNLVAFGGAAIAHGFYGLVEGSVLSRRNKAMAMHRARLFGFKGVDAE